MNTRATNCLTVHCWPTYIAQKNKIILRYKRSNILLPGNYVMNVHQVALHEHLLKTI